MAGSFSGTGSGLQPSVEKVTLPSNYLGSADFNFLNQYLPDVYEQEFERYGNRSVASFLRTQSAEMPTESDLIKWNEQNRLHIKYTNVTSGGSAADDTATLTIADSGVAACTIRIGQTVMISDNADATKSNKAIVTAVSGLTFDVAFYEAGGQANYGGAVSVFIYGSEFKKGTNGMSGQNEAETNIRENSTIILKDHYEVAGSDMAQIGWIEVSDENGGTGYLWYLKSMGETRMRFDDYLETAMIEAVPAEANSGAIAAAGDVGNKGMDGFFYTVENDGNLWAGGNPTTIGEFDDVVARLDAEGMIEQNALFVDRAFSFDIDDMLAAQNSYGSGGTSYGLFDNDEDMAINLGFSGFRRGYDFYKTDWKYLNDTQMRGGIVGGAVNGVLVPGGSTNVYDQVMGRSVKRPFLHIRYRANDRVNRRYQTWVLGSEGGALNSDLDAMQVEFRSERSICTLGPNNFVLFTD